MLLAVSITKFILPAALILCGVALVIYGAAKMRRGG